MHEAYLMEAIALAVDNVANGCGGPFGAIIVKEQKIIAATSNRVTDLLDPTAHAEIMAIRHACHVLQDFQLLGCTLYSSCEPCPMCLGAIYWARIDAVYFAATRHHAALAGFDDGFIYQELNTAIDERQIPFVHRELSDYQKPFVAWRDKSCKIPY
jgi:guanine deaminase